MKAKTATESYLVNYQLSELEAALPQAFFRARRSALVNLRRVKEIRPFFKSSFVLAMPDAAEIAVSAAGKAAAAADSGAVSYASF